MKSNLNSFWGKTKDFFKSALIGGLVVLALFKTGVVAAAVEGVRGPLSTVFPS